LSHIGSESKEHFKKFGQKLSKNNFELGNLSEAAEAVLGQKSFKWLIRQKFPLLRQDHTKLNQKTNNSKSKSHEQFKTSGFAVKHLVHDFSKIKVAENWFPQHETIFPHSSLLAKPKFFLSMLKIFFFLFFF
jgi:hypothetical protein